MIDTPSRSSLLFLLSIVGLLWYGFLWALGVLGCLAARKRYRIRPRSPLASSPPSSVPGVSILRPLKGLDTNLYENLESSFTQDYPNYEILLCVDNENDQALSVVRDLIAKYPRVNAKIVISTEEVGVNPKINNLLQPYRQAANDILWVIDSNIIVEPGTLARSVDALIGPPPGSLMKRKSKRISVVHHVPFAFSTESWTGSCIEEAFLNTNHAKMYIAINTVGVDSCVVGKSCLYRRSDVERVNGSLEQVPSLDAGGKQPGQCGLPAFGRFLAEDNMIASALWHELDTRHDLSCDVAKNVVGRMTLSDYFWRRVRWIRVRKHMVLVATLLEPFTESVMLACIASLCFRRLFGIHPLLTVVCHYIPWIYVDLDVYNSLAGHPLPASIRWRFMCGWMAREIMAFPIFLYAISGSEITWRGRRYRLLRNGEVERSWIENLTSFYARRCSTKKKFY
ncbi:hypothetical protein FISHEDRAFT_66827 [Fistulina hepatica ATCC 64428]|uniref:Ceramide glucosyltransferase n=1 Tax=Fistulina hepatica ATCC 64428 TaxID=1128425 RepID=A0A0D7A4M5_9AGAR|nr:hypothetical protein FISHEDRAFT_66827 [Fistulina hepatica ATCC 64428]